MTAHDCRWTLAPEMLDQARRVIDRAMANAETPETPELHGFSRWALQEATRLRALDNGEQRVCHFCGLAIEAGDKVIQAKTRNGWAHVTCWYDEAPFEREIRGLERRRSNR